MSWFALATEGLERPFLLEVTDDNVSAQLAPLVSDLGLQKYAVIASLIFLAMLAMYFIKIKNTRFRSIFQIALVLASILAAYTFFFIVLVWDLPAIAIFDKMRDGTFGDSFGTLNTLFSGLAFSGVLITIFIQRIDLLETRQLSVKQQTEAQFYNLLNLQQQVIQGFDLHIGGKTIQGRDCFRDWRRKLRVQYTRNRKKGIENGKASMAAYGYVLNAHLGDLGLYFRSLYTVFRYIDTIDHRDRSHYAVVVRSLLSDYELLLLFYNCLSVKGEKFMAFAEKHALFDNLNIQLLLSFDDVALMKASVYGKNPEALAVLEFLSDVQGVA
jgi:hypothetical protein